MRFCAVTTTGVSAALNFKIGIHLYLYSSFTSTQSFALEVGEQIVAFASLVMCLSTPCA